MTSSVCTNWPCLPLRNKSVDFPKFDVAHQACRLHPGWSAGPGRAAEPVRIRTHRDSGRPRATALQRCRTEPGRLIAGAGSYREQPACSSSDQAAGASRLLVGDASGVPYDSASSPAATVAPVVRPLQGKRSRPVSGRRRGIGPLLASRTAKFRPGQHTSRPKVPAAPKLRA